MLVKILVKVFWVVMLCDVAVGYQHFGGPLKHWYHTATLYGITTTVKIQAKVIWVVTAHSVRVGY
jgi:hypothetical protein